jgi:hypothetical protein
MGTRAMHSITVAGLVITEQQKAIGAARDLRKRWTDAVDPVTRSLVTPKDSVAALLRPELEILPYNNIHIEQRRALLEWALSPDVVALRFLTGGAGCGLAMRGCPPRQGSAGRGDWMLWLAQHATSSIDAISIPDLDAGNTTYDFWESQLGRRYLDPQHQAIRRHVRVRRVFVTDRDGIVKERTFQRICRTQLELGIEVRMLHPSITPFPCEDRTSAS